jgi:hypothetical protein
MANGGRMPVFMRVGTGDEHVIGSLAVEAVGADQATAGDPVKVRVVGGALATAELLEAVAAELRRQHATENGT